MKKLNLLVVSTLVMMLNLTSCTLLTKSFEKRTEKINYTTNSDFKWGVATSGYQIEGDNKPSIWSERDQNKGIDSQTYGNNFRKYHDKWIELAKDLNVNAFRLSIEWSRVQPRKPQGNDDGFDQKEIEFYKELIANLKRKNKIDPFVTLLHFNYPKWLNDETKGKGLLDPKFGDYYLKYVEKIATEISPDVKYWLTFNEPNVWLVACYYKNTFPPFYGKEKLIDLVEADFRLNEIHKRAYEKIHAIYKKQNLALPKVSMNFYYMPKPKFAMTLKGVTDPFVTIGPLLKIDPSFPGMGFLSIPNHKFMDFVAIDYYFRFNSTEDLDSHEEIWSKEIYPQGLYEAIMYYAKSPNFKDKEIIIAENGFATKDGKNMQEMSREEHLLTHIKEIFKAKADGANVSGYYYWSLMDNYEWGSYAPRFGLYHIPNIGNNLKINSIEDIFKEICPTKAAFIYKDIIKDFLGKSDLTPEELINLKLEQINTSLPENTKFCD